MAGLVSARGRERIGLYILIMREGVSVRDYARVLDDERWPSLHCGAALGSILECA